MESERAKRALEALLDDATRLGGALPQSHVDRVLDRRKLSPTECLEVYRALEARGALEKPETEEDLSLSQVESPLSDSGTESTSDSENQSAPLNNGGAPEEPEPSADALKSLASQFSEHSLLTSDEEIGFGRTIALGYRMKLALDAGSVPASSQALEVIKRGLEAREIMIRLNLRLVLKIAYTYKQLTSLDFDDLIQEGVLGLMRAVEKFDYSLGFRFSTYAFWWIRQAITRAILDKGETIRIPVHLNEKISKLRRAIRVLRRLNEDRFPSLSQLSDELDWPKDQIRFLIDLSRTVHISLEAPLNHENDIALLDLIEDDAPGPMEVLAAREEHDQLIQALETLSGRERDIIKKRFGVDHARDYTLEEIGQIYGITRERIRQLEEKALRKLRHSSLTISLRRLLYDQ